MPNRLLLADEDPQTLRVLEVSLRGAGFDVTSVTTGAAAWVAIDEELPQVILAATNLAALDGFELCARVRAREGGRDVAFLLLGDDDSLALRVKSIEAGADDYLLKPPYVQEVVARVRALVQRRDRETFTTSARAAEAFAGQLADLSVVDLLQVIADSRRSGIVHLRGPREAPATIYFRQGQVVDAEVGRLSGVNAISRLFSWTEGSFEVNWKPIRRPNAIGLATPELILQGMKRLDERNRLAVGLPDLNGVFEVNYRVLAERLSEIPDEVNAVLRLFDGSRTLAHVVEDCQLPDPEAMAIAIRLRDEGIIHNVSHPADKSGALVVPPRPAGRAPSADDVTVVRRITSLGTGSGPVQQAFAPTDARPPASAASAETVVGPLPVAPSSFDDVDGVISPANHAKTDPGLGQPLALSDSGPSGRWSGPALVGPDAVPAVRAGDGGAAGEVTAPNAAGGPPSLAASQPGLTDSAPPLGAQPQAESVADRVGLDADPSSLQTQRGLGPFPELFQAGPASTPAGAVSLDQPSLADDAQVTQPIELDARSAPNGIASGPASHERPAEPPPAESPASSAASLRSPAPAGEGTMPVAFAEEELSAKEALDELGVPGRKRGVAIVVGLIVAGAMAAVVVHKVRTGPAVPSSPSAASERVPGPSPGSSAGAPTPTAAQNQPPGAPPPSAEKAGGEETAAPAAARTGAATAEAEKAPIEPTPGGGEKTAPPAGVVTRPGPPSEVAATSREETAGAGSAPGPAAATGKSSDSATAKLSPAEKSAADPVTGKAVPAGKSVAATGKAAPAGKSTADAATGKAAPAGRSVAAAASAPAAAAPAADFAHQLATCRSQFLRDRLREAATTCAAALEANPGSADALTMMAHVELNRGHLGRANELAQKAIAIDPNQADAYVIMGGVHQDSGRNAQAKVSYRRYLQLAPHGRYADEVRSIVGSL